MRAADFLRRAFNADSFDVAVLGGSGVSLFEGDSLKYSDVPGMPVPHVEGHKGLIKYLSIHGLGVVAFEGRFHYYEGRSDEEVRFIPKLASELGCRLFLITSASGAVSRRAAASDFMVVNDHINLTGRNPLVGLIRDYGSRVFLNAKKLYDVQISDQLLKASEDLGIKVFPGVLAATLGPSYETMAEVRVLDSFGVDAVTMSFIPEAIASAFYGMKVAGLAILTNDVFKPEQASHEDVLLRVSNLSGKLKTLLAEHLKRCKENNLI